MKYIKKIGGGILLVIVLLAITLIRFEDDKKDVVASELSNEIIRFHVIANSDTAEDQRLKIKVKNSVVESMQQDLMGVESIEEAREKITKRLPELELLADSVMEEEGYDYKAQASIGRSYFPVKMYGDVLFPQGEYEAVKIKIGKSKGRNWWCVMYPTLCFVDESYQVVPEESKEELKEGLSSQEYEAMLIEKSEKASYRFAIVDWWNGLWS